MSQKIALVTGAMGGLGTAICQSLAKDGFKVVANCLPNFEQKDGWLSAQRDLGFDFVAAEGDVSNYESCAAMVAKIEAELGPIDVLVNNAGITRDGLAAIMKESDWDSVLDTNLKGAFLCSKAVMRAMMKKRWGRIINVSSVVGFVGNGGQVNYGAAKAGLVGLTKSLARELAGRNITVNCVAPGYITTDMTDGLTEDVQQALKAQIPLGILGTPEDVAASVGFLASADGKYLTGQTLHVNGGMYMGH